MTLRRSLSLLTLLPFVLVACADDGGGSGGASTDPDDLVGIVWRLDDATLETLAMPDAGLVDVSIEFVDNQVRGRSGCNSYFGGYAAGDDGSLSFDTLGGTEMACEEPLMALEAAYLTALAAVTSFSLNGSALTLDGGEVPLTFLEEVPPQPLPLVGTTWTLTTIASGDAVSSTIAGSVTTAVLDPDGTITGNADCNRYSGTYTQGEGGSLSFSSFTTTDMICSEDVMGQGSAFLASMAKVAAFVIEGAQLQLLDGGGALLLGFDGA